ncbi:creatininase family protein [Carboxylicivirga sp. N1Y90]|uniref:creatininase family protein n=1 Tax=Carboxylicivirga fragile TaxID=3417571 RepID=UPI003D32E69E|nr:creatininase family protein [Marinilabiliaceae bacterium N1Y90]
MPLSTQLEELHYKNLKNHQYELAILPWGATEAHNFHLPYGTDNFQANVIVKQSAQIANDKGASVLVLPPIPYGVNTGQTDIPYVINMMPSTQAAIIKDVAQSLFKHGVKKLLLFNGHGGNDFKSITREVGHSFPDQLICTCNWFEALNHKNYFDHAGQHADEMETSLMMYLYPELVLPLSEAGNGQHKKFRVHALNESWAWAEREWTKVSNDTGIGNPHYASAEKGEKYFNDVCQLMSNFFIELANTAKDDFYKY